GRRAGDQRLIEGVRVAVCAAARADDALRLEAELVAIRVDADRDRRVPGRDRGDDHLVPAVLEPSQEVDVGGDRLEVGGILVRPATLARADGALVGRAVAGRAELEAAIRGQ